MSLELGEKVWSERWEGWHLFVGRLPAGGFRAAWLSDWEDCAKANPKDFPTIEEAKAACYGGISLRCEIMMLEAQNKAREYRNS